MTKIAAEMRTESLDTHIYFISHYISSFPQLQRAVSYPGSGQALLAPTRLVDLVETPLSYSNPGIRVSSAITSAATSLTTRSCSPGLESNVSRHSATPTGHGRSSVCAATAGQLPELSVSDIETQLGPTLGFELNDVFKDSANASVSEESPKEITIATFSTDVVASPSEMAGTRIMQPQSQSQQPQSQQAPQQTQCPSRYVPPKPPVHLLSAAPEQVRILHPQSRQLDSSTQEIDTVLTVHSASTPPLQRVSPLVNSQSQPQTQNIQLQQHPQSVQQLQQQQQHQQAIPQQQPFDLQG